MFGIDFEVLGANIQMQRKLQHLTQQDLADKSGICKSEIWKIENGNVNLGGNVFNKVCKALSLNVTCRLEPEQKYMKLLIKPIGLKPSIIEGNVSIRNGCYYINGNSFPEEIVEIV